MISGLGAIDWLGVVGSLIVAGAYLAVSAGWVDARRPRFNLANLIGAGFILISLAYRPNPGAIVMEGLWALIALIALLRYWWTR